MTFFTVALITVCAAILWDIRRPILDVADEPSHVAWTSPVDGSYFEVEMPDMCDAFEIWETLAWIGGLPEVGAHV